MSSQFQFQKKDNVWSFFGRGDDDTELQDIVGELQRYKNINRKILHELQVADQYDKQRGQTGGRYRTDNFITSTSEV
jgi:hypothetical protein